MNNLSENSQHQEVLKQMHQLMIKELKRQRDPRAFGEGEVFDRYQYANLKEQNYYNRFIKGEKIKAGWVNPTDYAPKPLD